MKAKWFATMAGLVGLSAGLAWGQQGAPAPVQPVADDPNAFQLHVKSQIVVLDVVVTNRKGEPVQGLTAKDFKLYENKAPQAIDSFVAPAAAAATAVPVVVDSTTELDHKEPQAPVSILVLDEVTSRFPDQAFARYSLKKYLNTQGDTLAQPTMLVAVNLQRMMVLRDYTTSKKEILEALDKHFAGYNWQAEGGSWKGEQLNASFSALAMVAEATAGHPGHKNMVWIGRGFPSFRWDQLDNRTADTLKAIISTCTELLRQSRVTLYSVDPAGISAEPPATDEDGFYVDDPFGGQVDFDTMAEATGGQAFHGRNDVDHLIGSGVQDGELFYTMSYRPTTQSDDAKAFRNITVKMVDPSLKAITREGYFPRSAEVQPVRDAKGRLSNQVLFDVESAGQSLLVYDGIPLTIERDGTGGDKFYLGMQAADLPWNLGDVPGKRSSTLMVMVESFDRKGKMLNRTAKSLTFGLAPLTPGQKDEGHLRVVWSVATAAPAARLRFVVRSNDSGKVGAENFYLVAKGTLSDPETGLKADKR